MRPDRVGGVADLGVAQELDRFHHDAQVAARHRLLVLVLEAALLAAAQARHVPAVHATRERRHELAQQAHVLVVEVDVRAAGDALAPLRLERVLHGEQRCVT